VSFDPLRILCNTMTTRACAREAVVTVIECAACYLKYAGNGSVYIVKHGGGTDRRLALHFGRLHDSVLELWQTPTKALHDQSAVTIDMPASVPPPCFTMYTLPYRQRCLKRHLTLLKNVQTG
jgi:hypothetical protein